MNSKLIIVLAYSIFCGVAAFGEENICRYCQNGSQQRLLPRGLELQGRFQYAPDRQVDVTHIKIDVTPDFEKRTVSGTTSITATPILQATKILKLDAYNLKIREVNCEQAVVEDIVSTREDLRIVFREPLVVGNQYTIHIAYEAQPEAGLYFRTPSMGYPASDTHIWTQGEAHESRHWFPCFDYPNERSTTEIICHVPSDMTVLSNGTKISEQTNSDSLKSVQWLQDKPHVNYLVCLVAGYLDPLEKKYGDLSLGFYSQPSVREHAANSFEDTDAIMKFYEEEIGMDFPWDKYDQVTIHDFTAGGMENTSLTTLTLDTVFSKETENIYSSRGLDAHELAHQWFGDYVTCKDWSHLWLNEGFATYYTILYEGHKYGRDAMLYELFQDAHGSIIPNGGDKRPIVYNEYTNPMQQFDFRSYPKGSWVLHMLRSKLGEEVYRNCIKEYLEKHALGNVVSDDLRQVIESKTGLTLDRFFDQWLYHAGHPKLEIHYEWFPESNFVKINVKQTQEQHEKSMWFELPSTIRFHGQNKVVDHEFVIRNQNEDFYFSLDEQPKTWRFDPNFELLAEVTSNKSDENYLVDLTNSDDMIGRLYACRELAKQSSHRNIEALEKVLNADSFFGVRIAAAQALEKISTEESHAALGRSWLAQDNARVRKQVVQSMLNYFAPTTFELIQSVLDQEKNPAIRAEAVAKLNQYYGDEASSLLIDSLGFVSFKDEVANAAMNALRDSADETVIPEIASALKANEGRWKPGTIRNSLYSIGVLSGELEDKTVAKNVLIPYLQHPLASIQETAIEALGKSGDPSVRPILESYLDDSDEDRRERARNAVEALDRVQPLVPAQLAELQKIIQQVQDDSKKLQEKLDDVEKKLNASQKKEAAVSPAAP